MEPFGYLLLIAALVLLAGLMLYARFAGSATRKSLHHAPSDWVGTSFATVGGTVLASQDGPEPVVATGDETAPQLRLDHGGSPREGSRAVEDEGQKNYLDELQEAAAGLAMLMRSSPAARSQPVLFEPVESSKEIEPCEEVEGTAQSFTAVEADGIDAGEPVVVPLAESILPQAIPTEGSPSLASELGESTEAESGGSIAVGEESAEKPDGASDASDEPASSQEAVEMAEPTLDELLGAEVAEHFARIDGALDFLEELVGGIDSGLRLLRDPVEEFVPASFEEGSGDVSVAA